jgi:hypothetical protein
MGRGTRKKGECRLGLHSREGSDYAVISFGRSSTCRSRRSSGITERLRAAAYIGSAAAIAATAFSTGCDSGLLNRLGVLRINSMRLRTLNFTNNEDTWNFTVRSEMLRREAISLLARFSSTP